MGDDQQLMAPPCDSLEHKSYLAHCLDRLRTAQKAHDVLVPEWVENYKAFRALPGRNYPAGKKPWQTDHRPPYVAEQVNTMLPRLVDARPRVDIVRGAPDVSPSAISAQSKFMNHAMWQDGYALKSARWALHTILFGHGWSKQSYLHQQVIRDVMDRKTGRREERPLTVASRPTMGIGHPFDVMGDPMAPFLETARYVCWRTITTVGRVRAAERRQITVDGVKRWVGRYSNTDEVKPFGGQMRSGALPNEIIQSVPEHVSRRCNGDAVELIEVLDRERDMVFCMANRQVVIRAQRMPWLHGQMPVSLAITMPDVGTMMGLSKVEQLRDLQDNLWLREAQMIDNGRLQTDLVMKYRDTILDTDSYTLEPGAWWPVEQMDDIEPVQWPQQQLATLQDLELLRGRVQAFAGTAYMTGADPNSTGMGDQNTASGTLAIIQEATRSFDFGHSLMEIAHERALQQMLSDAAQYLEDAIFVPGASRGQDPIEVDPDVLAAASWVRVTLGSESGIQALRQQQSQMLLQTALSVPPGTQIMTPMGPRALSLYPAIEALADSWNKDPDDFLEDIQQAQGLTAGADPAAMIAASQEANASPGVLMPGMSVAPPVPGDAAAQMPVGAVA